MKLFVLIAILLLATASVSASTVTSNLLSEKFLQTEFSTFVKKFDKSYTTDAIFDKFDTFKANMARIHTHNANPNKSYSMAVNEFADLTVDEFKSKMYGYKHVKQPYMKSLNAPAVTSTNNKFLKEIVDSSLPTSVDWRQNNAVTPVKNQGQCGSCWSFSTTGSVEGLHAIKTGSLVSLSEQELMDCSTSYGNQGCNGGLMDQAFEFIIANKGLCSENSYPYTAADGPSCRSANCTSVATISGYKDVPAGDEKTLLAAVAQQPVSIAIEADSMAFQFYSGGVFDDASCGTTLDHGVLIVGYGTDSASGKDYYIVKNSWGATWGEQGYIRLVRNKNMCGLAQSASYPTL